LIVDSSGTTVGQGLIVIAFTSFADAQIFLNILRSLKQSRRAFPFRSCLQLLFTCKRLSHIDLKICMYRVA
jgi:hypothetical protein